MKGESEKVMLQELDTRIGYLRVEMTRLVHDGLDEDGTVLRRMLAELERLEYQRLALREQMIVRDGARTGGSHVGAIV